MSSPSLIAELEHAITNGSSEKRTDTLRRITSLFLDELDRLNEQQIAVFDDILIHLIQRIEIKALAQLSTALAPVHNAPIEVVRRLSGHDDITIAGPILTHSTRLSENDLIEIASSRGQGHLLAISGRASLPVSVTDVLVGRGDLQVYHALAKNSGAHFSDAGFATVIKKSESDDKLAEKLGLRLDIPLQLLRELLARATDVVRSRLLVAARPEHQEKIQLALAGIANEVRREAAGPRDYTHPDRVVSEINRRGKLTEAVLLDFVWERKYEEMTAALALFCGVKSELIERLLKSVRSDGLMVACKAAKLSWTTAELILKERFSHHAVSQRELDAAKRAFIELSQTSAQRSMRFMQAREATRENENKRPNDLPAGPRSGAQK